MRATFGNDIPTMEVDSLSDVDMSVFAEYQARTAKAVSNLSNEIVSAARIDRQAVAEFTGEVENRKNLKIDDNEISFKAVKPRV